MHAFAGRAPAKAAAAALALLLAPPLLAAAGIEKTADGIIVRVGSVAHGAEKFRTGIFAAGSQAAEQ